MPTLIKDLIEIPERIHYGDFVLKLTDGVTEAKAAETLQNYVVTPQLAGCFDNALAFIRSAIDGRSSKAAYLHGSFGSGKSHFMAVLYLLLQGSSTARSLSELASVVAEHDRWIQGKKFLLVPFHMIAARSTESAIFGQYVEYVRRLHPDAPVPGVYLAEPLFDNAHRLREQMGDETFFAQLNTQTASVDAGWGGLAAAWDATAFGRATAAPPGDEERIRLVSDLVETLLPAFQNIARAEGEAFVSLDEGLSILDRHARDLGYDALIFFLDELILWLASNAADLAFVSREGQKLAKLVEAQQGNRPIPLVSFVARQRDLRELVGDHVPGAQQLAFADVLEHQKGRFHLITLEDRNLPVIAEKRILAPKDDAARQELDGAFAESSKVRDDVMQTLLTSSADPAMFRQVYPFTPALVQTLVAISSVLQRERTALKVMLLLLVSQRDTLTLGQLVPVGDLYDVIAEGDEAFTSEMREYFDQAKRLYQGKLRPLLEQQHGVGLDELRARPADDPVAQAFRADDRILKTLLLSSLAPEVEALKALTPARLAALNHGSIRSPIAGREGQVVLTKCRTWASHVGEIRISDEGGNPTVSLQISGVDVEGILDRARGEDNHGNRTRKVREILFRELRIPEEDQLFLTVDVEWRGTNRRCELAYGNVREMGFDSLTARDDRWRVIVDFPFDVEGHTPADDLSQIEQFREAEPPTRTIVWVPTFLSRGAQKDLGTLVMLDHVLAGERFGDYASHLSVVDRAAARSLLDNRRSQLAERMRLILEGAYGVGIPLPGTLDTSHDLAEHVQSLDVGFTVSPPVAATLRGALEHLLDQALTHQFPAHPRFEGAVRPAALRRVFDEIQRAVQERNGRIFVEQGTKRQAMRQIAYPLQLGEMGENHFVLKPNWMQHFRQKTAERPGVLTVGGLRRWTDEPEPRGLPAEVANLVIMTYAEQANLRFTLHGGPVTPTLESLPDELELHEAALPTPEQWVVARDRAAKVFGLVLPELRSASNVGEATRQIQEAANARRQHAVALVEQLRDRLPIHELDCENTPRGQTALAVHALVVALERASSEEVVETLANAPVSTSDIAMGASLGRSAEVVSALEETKWTILGSASALAGDRQAQAEALKRRLQEALQADEYVLALVSALRALEDEAVALLTETTRQPPPVPEPSPPPGRRLVEEGKEAAVSAEDAISILDQIRSSMSAGPSRRLFITWQIFDEDDDQ